MKIILIGNYLPDKQESMIRFAQMLEYGYGKAGVKTEIWWPKVFFGLKSKNTNAGIGKWLGYLDKWVLFSLYLRFRLLAKSFSSTSVRFHICDHSNAPYLKYLPKDRTVITCHDVIAIRGGLGYTDLATPASRLGQELQKWILHHLSTAKLLAAVSELTLKQLKDLLPDQELKQNKWRVISNSFNAEFKPINKKDAKVLLDTIGLNLEVPYLLHVGSGQPRKNRKLLLDMVSALGARWRGNICFAGEALEKELLAHIDTLGLNSRVISVVKPEHSILVALYSTCVAFIFPSFSEGFGWPLIEAQACGAPVIASNIEPMPEVSGGTALHGNPKSPEVFAELFLSLDKKSTRDKVISNGFENAKRFNLPQMINAYLQMHYSVTVTA